MTQRYFWAPCWLAINTFLLNLYLRIKMNPKNCTCATENVHFACSVQPSGIWFWFLYPAVLYYYESRNIRYSIALILHHRNKEENFITQGRLQEFLTANANSWQTTVNVLYCGCKLGKIIGLSENCVQMHPQHIFQRLPCAVQEGKNT